MANEFLSALDMLEGKGFMKRVNFKDISEGQKEFLRDDLWDFKFTIPAPAVYYPGDDIIDTRLTNITPGIPTSISGISHTIRGFTLNQKTSVQTNGSMSLTFVDREDQAISAFSSDWKDKICDPDTKFSFRQEDTYAQARYTLLNSSRVPIRQLEFLELQPNDVGLNEAGNSNETAGSNSEITLSLDYNHHRRAFLNI